MEKKVEIIGNPLNNFKSVIKCGNVCLYLEKRFNWFNRLMFKFFFGLTLENLEEKQ